MRQKALLLIWVCSVAVAGEPTSLWRDPGSIQKLNLASGPGGVGKEPHPPFWFVKEEVRGISPKIVVVDGKDVKWMVKFGEEAKPETFASRISWAAGYPVRPTYFVARGTILEVPKLKRSGSYVGPDGTFHEARFQKFDGEGFRQVPGGKLDLYERREDQRELNGLKLTLLLVANWDVKPANTAVFDIAGQRYAAVSDWGASMGDPAAIDPVNRKWSCRSYSDRTQSLVDGVENGYVQFNYSQYASRHEQALSQGIRVDDLRWFLSRMEQLTDGQVRAALVAAGATPAETSCFATAFRNRLNAFATAISGRSATGAPPWSSTKKTVTTRRVNLDPK